MPSIPAVYVIVGIVKQRIVKLVIIDVYEIKIKNKKVEEYYTFITEYILWLSKNQWRALVW